MCCVKIYLVLQMTVLLPYSAQQCSAQYYRLGTVDHHEIGHSLIRSEELVLKLVHNGLKSILKELYITSNIKWE